LKPAKAEYAKRVLSSAQLAGSVFFLHVSLVRGCVSVAVGQSSAEDFGAFMRRTAWALAISLAVITGLSFDTPFLEGRTADSGSVVDV